ncbi:MAG: hypothetical protein HOP16_00555 [Acidobacteria bacterium]|nr:hypothetical protein [Acidobacteriota bacterium]
MRCLFARSIALALVLASAATASAQSLADVARREEERRKTVGTSSKVYTNDQLRPEPAAGTNPAPAPATPAGPAASEPATGASAAGAAEGSKPEGQAAPAANAPTPEQMWRKRVADERAAIARSQVLADALQSRINGLTTDFENRGDPIQKNALLADRQKALAELDRMKKEINEHQKTITTIQEEARRAGVPAGWTR